METLSKDFFFQKAFLLFFETKDQTSCIAWAIQDMHIQMQGTLRFSTAMSVATCGFCDFVLYSLF